MRWRRIRRLLDLYGLLGLDEEFYALGPELCELNWSVREELDLLKSALQVPRDMAADLRAWREQTPVPEEPLVSVCVATYNRARLLTERCIPSVLSQTYSNLEMVVVGDGCDDETERLVAKIDDPRLRFVNLPRRGDYPADPLRRWMVAGTQAINHALALARGDYVTHLDDDDEYAPDRLEKLTRFAVNNGCDVVWHPFWIEDPDGSWRVIDARAFTLRQVTTGSVFYRSWFKRIGWDVEAHRLAEPGDWNRYRKFKYIGALLMRYPEPLLKHYREHIPAPSGPKPPKPAAVGAEAAPEVVSRGAARTPSTADDGGPKVSVLLVTYNHREYVRQALDSVVTQQADFDFEIVVADDHSRDSTLEIVNEYRSGDRIVRVLDSERNVGITRNYERGFAACRGRYVAVLEGDDFWLSPAKLRTTAAFLDEHPECSFCFHRFLRRVDASGSITVHPRLKTEAGFALFTAADLARGNFVGNFSACVYRRDAVAGLDPRLFEMKVYDWMFNIALAREGMIGYIPRVMSLYRSHSAGAWSGLSPAEQTTELLPQIDVYNEYLNFEFDRELQECKRAALAGADARRRAV